MPKLDRLARSVPDARAIADQLAAKGVKLALGASVYDPTDPMGKMFFNILATFAEFESDLIRMRTREGMANAQMVASGHAWAFLRYSRDYEAVEATARDRGLGIWQVATQPAWDYRADRWVRAEDQSPNGCPIKGNISKSGMIYHTPWSPFYSRTKINTAKGERWFCSEAEAVAAGWRAPRWGG